MDNSIKPYDLGNYPQLVESCQKISIDGLVRIAMKDLKKRIVEAQVEALGMSVSLTTSRTRFDGERLWFVCPQCERRSGTLFKQPLSNVLGCKKCLILIYRKQRYKGMTEIM